MDTLTIDGSYGEGGGQILRTAATFSVITGRPVRIHNIRAGRGEPGLRTQHLAVLRVLKDLSNGTLDGGVIGSTEVSLSPGRIESRRVELDLGTAASITLLLQAVVPAVALSGTSLEMALVGGTDVPWSPTSDYLREVVVPSYRLAGISFAYDVEKRGYYPRGGGRATLEARPSSVRGVDLSSRGGEPVISVTSRCGMLPRSVAQRQAHSAVRMLEDNGITVHGEEVSLERSDSPGSSVIVSALGVGAFIGSDAIGERGKPAEAVGSDAAARFLRAYGSGATVDPNLADMLAPLLCLAASPSRLLVQEVTGHMATSLHVAQLFTGAASRVTPMGGCSLVEIDPQHNS